MMKDRVLSKGAGSGEDQAHESELWSEEDCAWCSRGKRGKTGFSKGKEGSWKGGFRTNPSEKSSCSDCNPHKGRGKDRKGKRKEGACPQSGFSASENPVGEGQGCSWESDDWCSNITDDSSTSTTVW